MWLDLLTAFKTINHFQALHQKYETICINLFSFGIKHLVQMILNSREASFCVISSKLNGNVHWTVMSWCTRPMWFKPGTARHAAIAMGPFTTVGLPAAVGLSTGRVLPWLTAGPVTACTCAYCLVPAGQPTVYFPGIVAARAGHLGRGRRVVGSQVTVTTPTMCTLCMSMCRSQCSEQWPRPCPPLLIRQCRVTLQIQGTPIPFNTKLPHPTDKQETNVNPKGKRPVLLQSQFIVSSTVK